MKSFLLMFTSFACLANGWNANLSKGKTTVEFEAKGFPKIMTVQGKSETGVSGDLSYHEGRLTGTCEFSLDTLETGMSTRDKHMKEKYLQIKQFPKAKLHFEKVPAGTKSAPFEGKLALHGQVHPIKGSLKLAMRGRELLLDASFPVQMSEFHIPEPSFMGIHIKDEVNVKVHSEVSVGASGR